MADSFDIDEINRQALLGSDTESEYSEAIHNSTNKPNDKPLQPLQEIESEPDRNDATETKGDNLWANKNYQFETKSPSFYESTPQVERRAISKIDYAINTSEKCAKCNKTVYAQEEIKALNKKFHKACFRCHDCKSTLQTNRLAEHGQDVYCQNCYDRNFGSRKYADSGPTERSNESLIEEGTFSSYPEFNSRRKTIANIEPDVNSAYAFSNRRKSTVVDEDSSSEYREIKSLLKPLRNEAVKKRSEPKIEMKKSDSGPIWSKDMLKPFKVVKKETEKCVRCAKAVYAAEEVKANDKIYHKFCLKCFGCNKMLDGSSVIEHDKATFCQNCYIKLMSKQHRVSEVKCEHVEEIPMNNYDG